MTYHPQFKVFTMLKYLTKSIQPPIIRAIDGAEYIRVSDNGLTVDPEFWIGKSIIKTNGSVVKDE